MKTQSGQVVSEATRSKMSVRVPLADEVGWFDGLLSAHHYLGAGQAVGDYLRQVVEREGSVVALLVWGPACYALKDRDLWISWSAPQRLERLKLIVQNRRFLVLAKLLRKPLAPPPALRRYQAQRNAFVKRRAGSPVVQRSRA